MQEQSREQKVMFLLGLFVGIAACMTAAVIFVVWSFASGKGLSVGSGAAPQGAVAQVPSQAGEQPSVAAGPVKPIGDTDHVRGAKNAKVTVIEYSDFECPFCKRHAPTMDQVLKDYPNDVRVAFRHFPLSFHANAQKQHEASECVAELAGNDGFWEFHDKLFERTLSNGTGFALESLPALAKEVGANEAKFKECLDSGKYAAKVAQDMQEGSAAGVEGTPATFVNGQLLSGAVPYASFKAIIDAELKK